MGIRYTKNHTKRFLPCPFPEMGSPKEFILLEMSKFKIPNVICSILSLRNPHSAIRNGFTLIELLVTVIIVGVLVAVAVPIFRQNVRRVMATEGHALAGSIKTAERIYFAEKNSYTDNWADLSGSIDIDDNKYFITPPTITAAGKGSSAFFVATVIGSGEASGISVAIDSGGSITVTGFE